MKNVPDGDSRVHWHDLAALALRIDYEEYDRSGAFVFETEHEFGKQPPVADIIIIKKDDSVAVGRGVAKIFRRINIIEYKNPRDSLTVNDFYKILGYACFYIDQNHKDKDGERLSLNDLTVTYLVTRRPRKLFAHLAAAGFAAAEEEAGIHAVGGGIGVAAQIVETRRLAGDIVLKSLRDDLTLGEAVELADGIAEKHNRHLTKYIERLADLNTDVFKEVNKMGKGLERLLKETGLWDQARQIGREEGAQRGLTQGVRQGAERVLSLVRQGYSADAIERMLRDSSGEIGLPQESSR